MVCTAVPGCSIFSKVWREKFTGWIHMTRAVCSLQFTLSNIPLSTKPWGHHDVQKEASDLLGEEQTAT